MNTLSVPSSLAMSRPAAVQTLESRYGMRVTARLNERLLEIEPDIGERLRVAREQALERARTARAATAPVGLGSHGGAAVLGGGRWWLRVAAVLPALALLAGLLLIQQLQTNDQIAAAAEIDAALLTDDLPPNAYSDAGFAEFLKSPGD